MPLISLFVLAYALSWEWWLPIAVSGGSVARGDAWPTHLPGPARAPDRGLVVLTVTEGRAGVRRWLGAMVLGLRERRWRLAAVAASPFSRSASGSSR